MLAAALNHIGSAEGQKFAPMFAKSLEGFTVIEIISDKNHKEGRLQLCQPEGYNDLQKYLRKQQDQDGAYLVLRGPKDKILRSIRYMFFFDEGEKYNKVLLEGADGVTDFAWALQIVVIEPPVPPWERAPEWLLNADIFIINATDKAHAGDLSSRIKTIRPDVPFFMEKIQEGLSQEIRDSLYDLFDDYQEKRWAIKDLLELQYPDRQITCVQARNLAGNLKVRPFLVGSVCDELGYSVTRCSLGCF